MIQQSEAAISPARSPTRRRPTKNRVTDGADPRQRAEQLERDDVGTVEQVRERRVEVALDRERVDGAAEHDRELAAQDLERLDARVRLVGVDHRRRRVEQQPTDHHTGQEHQSADDQRGHGDPPGWSGRFVAAEADDVVGERDPVGFDSGAVGLGFVDHDDLQSVPSRPLVVRRRWWHIGQQGHSIPRRRRGELARLLERGVQFHVGGTVGPRDDQGAGAAQPVAGGDGLDGRRRAGGTIGEMSRPLPLEPCVGVLPERHVRVPVPRPRRWTSGTSATSRVRLPIASMRRA